MADSRSESKPSRAEMLIPGIANMVSRKIFLLFAVTGFSFQVFLVSKQYFGFITSTQSQQFFSESISKHKVALCIRYNDILDIDRLENETGIHIIRLSGSNSMQNAIENESKLTVKQIFEYTPKAEEIIKSCMHRPDDWEVEIGNSDRCYEIYKIQRAFTQDKMCYIIQDTTSFTPSLFNVTTSTYYPYIVYDIQFNEKLAGANIVNVIAFNGVMPWVSRRTATSPESLLNENGTRLNNAIIVTPSDIRTRFLKPPYDTMCVDRDPEDMRECRQGCITYNMIESLDRLPYWLFITAPIGIKPVTIEETHNSSFRNEIELVKKYCEKLCDFPGCHEVYTRTKAVYTYQVNTTLRISVSTAVEASTRMKYYPAWEFLDYFTYVTTCFGTWLGLSFLHFNPSRYISVSVSWVRKKEHPKFVTPPDLVLEYASVGKVRYRRRRNRV